MKLYPNMYSRRSDGKIQLWRMEQDGSNTRTFSSLSDEDGNPVESSIVISTWKSVEGTNVGRANERTPEQQAEFQIKSAYTDRESSGASYTYGVWEAPKFVSPMLAATYADKLTDNCYSQPKLDGGRAIVSSKGSYSRNGKEILSAPHIFEILKPWVDKGIIFDGELYNHDLKHDFNKIMSLIRKSKPTDLDIEESKGTVQYWVYDIVDENLNFSERSTILKDIVASISHPSIVFVPTEKIASQDHLDELYASYMEEGYEGQMIRLDSSYEFKRSKNLLKRKSFIDAEFQVIEILEGEGNWSGCAKVVNCFDRSTGKFFKATLKMNQEAARIVLAEKDKYIGGDVTVRYQNLTPDGIPRFGIGVMLYEGKREI